MTRVRHAWAAAVAVVALLAPFAAAPAFATPSDAAPAAVTAPPAATPAAVAAPAVHRVPAVAPASTGLAAAAAHVPAEVPGIVSSEEFPGGTSDGVTIEDPDNGVGFDLAITATPATVQQGGPVDVAFTVTNHDVPLPEVGAVLLVALSWNTSQFRSVTDSATGDTWANRTTTGNYRYDTVPRNSGAVCVLGGMAPGVADGCSAQFRHLGGRPAAISQFTVEVVSWGRALSGSTVDDLEPIAIDPNLHALASAPVESDPVFDLTVENYDHLSLAAVGDDEPVLGRFAVFSNELALRPFDDAELVVRLSWPQGMVLEDPPPTGCIAVGTSALDCTIDDANLLPGLPDEPVDYDDLYPRVLREWDLHFTPPASQAERERLDAFAISFVSGWTYIEPIISLTSWANRSHGASGVGLAPTSRMAPTSRTVPAARETRVVPAASPPPSGGVAMTPAWASSDSTPFALLDRVFTTTTEADAEFLSSSGGDEVTVVFTVTHHPEVTTVLPASQVSVQLDWPEFVDPLDVPDGCTSYLDHVCMIEGLDEPGATAEITMEFEVRASPPAFGRFRISAESVVIVESNSDGDIEHGYPDRWIESSSDRLTLDDALVTLDVILSEDYVWEDGPMLAARVIPTRAERDDGDGGDLWDQLIVGIAITWPEYLTLVSTPSGCTLQTDGMVCEVVLEEPGMDPGLGVLLAFTVGPGVTDGLVAAEGASLQEFDGEETDDLPAEWVIPDEEPLAGVAPFIPLDVEVERDLVWEGGDDVGATITATRNPFVTGDRREPFGVLVVDVEITWPAFLHPTGPPTGCESWDGTICVILLPKPGAVVEIGLEFSVGGAPPGASITGAVRAEAVRLIAQDADGAQDLPTEWVTPDEDSVTRIRATIGLDLTLDHDPGYTGGKQLVVTTTVTREKPGPDLPGLEVVLDFDWAGYLTRTAQTGCATFAGSTCTVTGLDEPGASAVVTLTFSMPPPTLPPAPEVAPRTDDVVVDGVGLSFVPPPAEPPPPEPPDVDDDDDDDVLDDSVEMPDENELALKPLVPAYQTGELPSP